MTEERSLESERRITLALETATSTCSVALFRGEELLAEASETADRQHNEIMPVMVQELYRRAGVEIGETGLIAMSIGPGSFTGLRVGLSFAKGMALGTGARIVPVGTLDALAGVMFERIVKSETDGGKSLCLCPMTVARKGEAFAGLFEARGSGVEARGSLFLCGAGSAGEQIGEIISEHQSNASILIGGEGAEMLFGNEAVPLPTLSGNSVRLLAGVRSSAEAVGRLGLEKVWAGEAISAARDLEPMYLKEFTVGKK